MVLETTSLNNILKEILNSTHLEKYDIVIEEFESRGKNYAGEIFFVNVKKSDDSEKINLFIKQAFVDEYIRKFLPIRDFYLNENHFYENIWKNFTKFQEENHLKPFELIPKCYLTKSNEAEETIVLEKLTDYRTNDTKFVFEKDQLSLIFEEYGKFHALSFAYKDKRPEEYRQMTSSLRDNHKELKNVKMYADTMNFSHELCYDFVVSEKNEEIIRKYKKYSENAMDIYIDSSVYNGNKSVVNHGDCWISNYLFKYSENGAVQDLKFIDFQLSRTGTPIYDLSCCIYACSTKDNYNNLDFFLEIYHKTLSKTLKSLDCDPEKIYSYENLKNDWKNYCKFGFTYAVFIIRNSLINEDMVRKTTEIAEKGDARKNADLKFDEAELKERLLGLVTHMAENDFL